MELATPLRVARRGPSVGSQSRGGMEEGEFGRIARPSRLSAGVEHGVAARGDRLGQCTESLVVGSLRRACGLTSRLAIELHLVAECPDRRDAHPVYGQRARLVG